MSINNQKKIIFKNNLKQNVCFVTLSSYNPGVDISDETKCGVLKEFPVTLYNRKNDVYSIPSDIKAPEETSNNVAAWDIHQKKYILIDMDDLLEWSFQSTPKEEPEGTDPTDLSDAPPKKATELYDHNFDKTVGNSIDMLKDFDKKLNDCARFIELGFVDKNKLKEILYRRDCDDITWRLLKAVGFTCDCLDDLINADAQDMVRIREGYMNYIRLRREASLLELDGLEQEIKDSDGSVDDLQDVDTIKQMFRDIPQDTDLSGYCNAKELLSFWPSLLLPTPIDGLCHAMLEPCDPDFHKHTNCSPDVQRMCKCVDSLKSSDVEELVELIKLAEQEQQSKEQIKQNVYDNLRDQMHPSEEIIENHVESIYNDQMYLMDHMRNKLNELTN